jgi:hypothetical protein
MYFYGISVLRSSDVNEMVVLIHLKLILSCCLNRNIYILSDSQAAVKALSNHQTNSKLLWDCHQSLMQLPEHNTAQMIQVPGHEGIDGNEMSDQLAKQGFECPFIGCEPACGISTEVSEKAVRDSTIRDLRKHSDSLCGLKQAKGLIHGPSVKNRNEL